MARPPAGERGPDMGSGRVTKTRRVLLLCLQVLLLHHAVNAQQDMSGAGDPTSIIDTRKLINATFSAPTVTRTFTERTPDTDISNAVVLSIPAFAGESQYLLLSFQQDGSWMAVNSDVNRRIGVSVTSTSSGLSASKGVVQKTDGVDGAHLSPGALSRHLSGLSRSYPLLTMRTPLEQTTRVVNAFTPSSSDFGLVLPFLQEYSPLGALLEETDITFFAIGEYDDYDPSTEAGSRFQSILFSVIKENVFRLFYIANIARIDTDASITVEERVPLSRNDGDDIVGEVKVHEISIASTNPTVNQLRQNAIDDFSCRSFTSTAPALPIFSFCPFFIVQASGGWFDCRPLIDGQCIIRDISFIGFGNLYCFCSYTSIPSTPFLILEANRGFIFREFREIALQQACQRAGRQQDFNAVCPPTNSASFRTPIQGQGQGDASVTTFDGFNWEFNAIGFFIYWMIGTARIDVRMESANPESPGPAGAVIGGVAIQDRSSTIVAQITGGALEILVFDSGSPVAITATDYNADGIFNNGQIQIRQNPAELWTWFIIGIQDIDYAVWVAMYQPSNPDSRPYILILLSLDPEVYFGDVTMRGLLGNWDDDPSNDLIPRGGTVADAVDTGSSELEILNNFAMTYSVSNTETIYPSVAGGPSTDEDFGKANHEPRDCESLIAGFANQAALAVCNGNRECECEFVINGEAAALDVLMLVTSVSNTTQALRMAVPSVNGSDFLQIRVGEPFTTTYFAQGEGGVVLGSTEATLGAENLPPGATFEGETGVFSWTPDGSILGESDRLTTELSITVFTPEGIEGIQLNIFIRLCGTVIDQGECNYDQPLGDTDPTSRFVYVSSICNTGWTGDFCEIDFDGCEFDTCAEGSCMDQTPSEQEISNVTYTCGACDNGFILNTNLQCSDIFECADDSVCEQECENTIGSFICSCMDGYMVEGTNCTDIDECSVQIDNCDQVCNNTMGSFVCECVNGYDLVGGVCEPSSATMAACAAFPCDEEKSICTLEGVDPECRCKRGYQPSSRANVCEDIDECTNMTDACRDGSHCQNTEGGYSCTCEDGFTTDADQRGCTPCADGLYGNECTLNCNCAVSNCNATIGCESCISGLSGTTCADINECDAGAPNPCGNFSTCENSPGSFQCLCNNRYELNTVSGQCEAINQCDFQPCEFGMCTPIGTEYHCACFGGYTGRNCDADIDECATSAGLCLNGGTCRNLINAFQCDCPPEFTGRRCEVETDSPTDSPIPTEPPEFVEFEGSFVINCELPSGTDTGELEDSLADTITQTAVSELEVTEAKAEITDVSEEDRLFTFSLLLSGKANITNTDVLNTLGRTFDPTFGSSVELTCPDNVTELEVDVRSLIVGDVTVGEEEEDFNALPVILGTILGVLGIVLFTILIAVCARRAYNARVIVRPQPNFAGYSGWQGGIRWLPRGVMDARNLANIRRRERPMNNPWAADVYELETDEMPWNAWRGADNAYYGRSALGQGQFQANPAVTGAVGGAVAPGRVFRGITSANFARPLPAPPPARFNLGRHGLPRFNFSRPSLPNFRVPNFNNGMRRMSGWLSRMPWRANVQQGPVVEPVYGSTPVYGSPVSTVMPNSPMYAAPPTVVTSPMVLMNQGVQLQQGQQFHWQPTSI